MKLENIDWSIIRGSLISLIISLIVSGGLVGGSYLFAQKMNKEYLRNNAQFKAISLRYLAIDEEEGLISDYYPQFVKLYEKGVIGKERRLDWIEILRDAGNEIKVHTLNFKIDSQNIYVPEYAINLGHFKLYSSKMSLDMQLLHEGDLFNFFQYLDEGANGIYGVSSCNFTGKSVEISDDPTVANIEAKCDLDWYTIKLANGKEMQI